LTNLVRLTLLKREGTSFSEITLPEFPALAPTAIPLALPSRVGLLLSIAAASGLGLVVSDTTVSVLALCSARVPMSLRLSIDLLQISSLKQSEPIQSCITQQLQQFSDQ
jgi:hypothetical protein